MKPYRGFVLIVTLVFLQVLASLACYALLDANYFLKSEHHAWQRDRVKSQMNIFLRSAEERVTSRAAHCLVPITASHAMAQQPISWWRQYGCSDTVDGVEYIYVVEDLGLDPCAKIIYNNNQGLIAQYFRVTLLAMPVYLQPAKFMLQSTLAQPVEANLVCQNQVHLVYNGRQSLQE